VALAFGLLPILGLNFLESPLADWGFVGFASLVGIPAVISGHRKHHRWQPAFLFGLGIGLVLYGLLGMNHQHESPAFSPAHLVTMVGGLTLVGCHLLNQKYAHTCCGKLACPHQSH